MATAATSPSSRRSSGPVIRSLSPSGRFHSPSSSPYTSSSSSSSPLRSTSPSRVNLCSSLRTQSSPSVRFSILDRPISPSPKSISSVPSRPKTIKRSCMCSPTTHPGSFRCSLHKNITTSSAVTATNQISSCPSNGLNARRSAMVNSLVRIGTVEGDLVKRALTALIRPSSHHQRRRGVFQPRPSRLSVMSKAEDFN